MDDVGCHRLDDALYDARAMKQGSNRRTNSRLGCQADGTRVDSAGYVTHADLLRLAQRRRCYGIHTEPVLALCQPAKSFWVFKATVYKSAKCRGFVGYGDAHPGNVSP